jgi:hypothetical protein
MEQVNMVVESARTFLVQIGQFLPQLLAAVVVLIIGWLLAKAVNFAVVRGLKAIRFDTLTEMAGMDGFLKQGGMKKTTVDLLGILIYWLVILVTLLAAFNILGLSVLSEMFRNIVLFIPNVLVAVLILAIGLYFARFVSDAIIAYGKNVGMTDIELLGRIVRYAIMVFVVILALGQMNIGQQILHDAFRILFGAICLALALMFGLGGQKWAAGALERFVEEKGKRK